MTILNNNMNHASAAALVMNAFKKTAKVNFKPYHWTFTTKDGTETVEFIAGKLESQYVYTRVKKFLCFKLGVELEEPPADTLPIPVPGGCVKNPAQDDQTGDEALTAAFYGVLSELITILDVILRDQQPWQSA